MAESPLAPNAVDQWPAEFAVVADALVEVDTTATADGLGVGKDTYGPLPATTVPRGGESPPMADTTPMRAIAAPPITAPMIRVAFIYSPFPHGIVTV